MSLAALFLYGAAIVSSLSAARRAWLFRMPSRDRTLWLLVAFTFAILLVFRLEMWEETLRENLRAWVQAEDLYRDRRMYQAPLAVIVLVGALLAGAFVWRRWFRRIGSSDRLALRLGVLSLAGFAPLYLVRLISLHATDRILYSGPIRLNWLLELGLCGLGMSAALAYGEMVKRRNRADRGERPAE